ncbi:MAG: D-2-hydroxyacid dehydrogenase [Clostridia bacterium]|nr:D-2-hydroxyacid dehydrogenase [Clostridia bacterium]
MLNISILEKDTLTTGDMDFTPFDKLGKVNYYNSIKGEELISAVKDADLVFINKTQYTKELFDLSKNLKFIGIFATGFNNVDLEEATKRGVTVCNVPAYSTSSVAQLTMTFILELASNLSLYNKSTHDGKWIESSTFSYFPYKFSEIEGKTLGIFGLGDIGINVAKRALAFGMKVIAYTRTPKTVDGVELVEKEELFKRSDFLTLHSPLNKQTEKTVNEYTLSLMRPTAFIINTSRGGVIDETALANALKTKQVRGAALDVLTKEPMQKDCPLFGLENCIITPHIAWTTEEARRRLLKVACENAEMFLKGTPQNVVNGKI